jgi:hypothetical protein
VYFRRAICCAAFLACVGTLLQACDAKPFGSDLTSISKNGRMYDDVLVEPSKYNEAKPTYTIFGPIAPGESPEIKGERIMRLACPLGDPHLTYADAISGQMAGRGSNTPFFGAAFTCNNVLW